MSLQQDEFAEIYLKYSDKIFRYLYFQTKDFYLSEDLTSEVFVRAWKDWERLRHDFMQAWLYKTARNLLIDWYRKKKETIFKVGFEIAYDENLLEKIEKDEEFGRLARALESLPENLKIVAILRFIENLSARDVAVILEISEVNVRVLQHRALVKLKKILKNEQR